MNSYIDHLNQFIDHLQTKIKELEKETKETSEIICSFCDEVNDSAVHEGPIFIIGSKNSAICEDCVKLCNEIIRDKKIEEKEYNEK